MKERLLRATNILPVTRSELIFRYRFSLYTHSVNKVHRRKKNVQTSDIYQGGTWNALKSCLSKHKTRLNCCWSVPIGRALPTAGQCNRPMNRLMLRPIRKHPQSNCAMLTLLYTRPAQNYFIVTRKFFHERCCLCLSVALFLLSDRGCKTPPSSKKQINLFFVHSSGLESELDMRDRGCACSCVRERKRKGENVHLHLPGSSQIDGHLGFSEIWSLSANRLVLHLCFPYLAVWWRNDCIQGWVSWIQISSRVYFFFFCMQHLFRGLAVLPWYSFSRWLGVKDQSLRPLLPFGCF